MGILKDKKANDYIIIVGCGRLGANLSNSLSDSGCGVMIIDEREEAFRKISPSYGGLSLVGNATELNTLNEANIDNATAIIIVTNNDNTNILVAQIVKEIYKIEHVIARLYDPERECVYREFGIDTICPAILSAKEIQKLLRIENGR